MEVTREEAERVAPLLAQELAGDVPERYVVRHQDDRPTIIGAPVAPIPVIDLGRLSRQHTADGTEEAAKLWSALQSWGLFLVTNHGVEPCVMDAMMNASREFFRRPMEEKRRYTEIGDGEHYEDHLEGNGSEQLKSQDMDQPSLDWADRLYLKVEPQDERSLHLWHQCFRDVLHDYAVQQRTMLNNSLLPAMARLLGLEEGYSVRQLGDQATAYARIIYYPPCPRPEHVLGIKPHSDATLVTVLMVDDQVGGLQVLRDGVWYDVPAKMPAHALLINIGDLTEIMSNGAFKSPVHRVVTNAKKGRNSVAVFYGPNLEEEIEPADELIDHKRPARYKRVKVKEYVAGLYEHFSQGARVIDTVRI